MKARKATKRRIRPIVTGFMPKDCGTCAVARYYGDTEYLIALLDRCDAQQRSDDKVVELRAQRAGQEIDDRRQEVKALASQTLARSATGALFQVMLINGDLDDLMSNEHTTYEKGQLQRCMSRNLYSVMRALEALGAQHNQRTANFYMAAYLDPHAAMATAGEYPEAPID